MSPMIEYPTWVRRGAPALVDLGAGRPTPVTIERVLAGGAVVVRSATGTMRIRVEYLREAPKAEVV